MRFKLVINGTRKDRAVALVSLYSDPHPGLLAESSQTYWTMSHGKDTNMLVVDVKTIQSAVCIAPDKRYGRRYQDGTEKNRWYMSERPGLKLSSMIGIPDPDIVEAE
jgi:hypothetical protein